MENLETLNIRLYLEAQKATKARLRPEVFWRLVDEMHRNSLINELVLQHRTAVAKQQEIEEYARRQFGISIEDLTDEFCT